MIAKTFGSHDKPLLFTILHQLNICPILEDLDPGLILNLIVIPKKFSGIGHLYCMLKTRVNVITTDVCYGEGYFSRS